MKLALLFVCLMVMLASISALIWLLTNFHNEILDEDEISEDFLKKDKDENNIHN